MPDNDDDEDQPLGTNNIEDDDNAATPDDDPVAEGEAPAPPQRVKVAETMANSSKFAPLCLALETVWKAGKTQPLEKRLARLLPPKALAAMTQADPPESIFPIFRLLLPSMDTRMTFVGESKVADMYSGLLNLSKVCKMRAMLMGGPRVMRSMDIILCCSSL